MLATLGFAVTGICFAAFAFSFNKLVVQGAKLKLSQFAYGYYALALAFFVWGFAADFGSQDVLKNAVIIGDAYLLLGSLFMLDIWLGKKRRTWLALAAAVAAALLYVRVTQYPPSPYLRGGILIFNTQPAVATAIGLLIAFIWLPVNIKVSKLVTRKIGQKDIAFFYTSVYTAATASALIFIVARRTITVVLSFIAVGICFAVLIKSNILVAKLTKVSHSHGK